MNDYSWCINGHIVQNYVLGLKINEKAILIEMMNSVRIWICNSPVIVCKRIKIEETKYWKDDANC